MDQKLRRLMATNGLVALAAVGLGLWALSRGDRSGVVVIVGVAVALWWAWPTRGPHVDQAEAVSLAGPSDVIIYWRPGCTFCARLSIASRLTRWTENSPRRIHVNIWRDPAAAATVRSVRDGFETVPTVVSGDGRPLEATVEGIQAGRPLHR